MRTNHADGYAVPRLGRLVATPDLMAAVSRGAMGRALRCHRNDVGGRRETRHSDGGRIFRVRTEPDGSRTAMWLEGGEAYDIPRVRRG